MRPRILQLIDSFQCGGTERQAVQLARLLHENSRYEVYIACLDGRGPLRRQLESLTIKDITEYPLTTFYDANFLGQLHRFATYLRRRNIGLVHSHDFYTNIFGMAAAYLARVPARVASRRETASALRSKPQRIAERWSYALANAIIGNCDCVGKQLIAEGVPAAKVTIVHNGIDLERFVTDSSTDRDSIAESLGIKSAASRPVVTLVANLRSPVKDHPTFLRAAALIRAAVPDAVFVIAGEGELAHSLQSLAAQVGLEDSAFFIGRCDQIPNLLAISDVCVLTSKAEGFPNVILEYMASSRPVVTTDVGGAREVVIDGKTGFVVPVGNSAILAGRVIYLLRNTMAAARMGELGRSRVEHHFSSAVQLRKIECVYDKLLTVASNRASRRCLAFDRSALSGHRLR